MALHVLCPHCHVRYEVADEQAGGTATCPACGTLARIPPIASPYGVGPQGTGQPSYAPGSPYASPQFPADPRMPDYGDQAQFHEMIAARFEVHRRLIAIFGIIVAVFGLLWASMYVSAAVQAIHGELPLPPHQGLGLSKDELLELLAVIYVAMAVLAAITSFTQILAGILLLRRTRGCRKLGIAAGILSCVSVWGCLVWLPCLGYGIYALVILCGRDAAMVLGPRPGPPPGQSPWDNGGPPQAVAGPQAGPD